MDFMIGFGGIVICGLIPPIQLLCFVSTPFFEQSETLATHLFASICFHCNTAPLFFIILFIAKHIDEYKITSKGKKARISSVICHGIFSIFLFLLCTLITGQPGWLIIFIWYFLFFCMPVAEFMAVIQDGIKPKWAESVEPRRSRLQELRTGRRNNRNPGQAHRYWRVRVPNRSIDRTVPTLDNLSLEIGSDAGVGIYGTGILNSETRNHNTSSSLVDIIQEDSRTPRTFGNLEGFEDTQDCENSANQNPETPECSKQEEETESDPNGPLPTSSSSPFACNICFLEYNTTTVVPRILIGCGHTVCQGCIQKFSKDTHDGVICPFCRKTTRMPGGEIKNLPKNFALLERIQDV